MTQAHSSNDNSGATAPGQTSNQANDLDDIYRALKRGVGRERVDDNNVDQLVQMAQEQGDAQLEYLLREWRSPCGEDADAPALTEIQGVPPQR